MQEKEIETLLESVTPQEISDAIKYASELALFVGEHQDEYKPGIEMLLIFSALYKLGKLDAVRPSPIGDPRPITDAPFPT